MIIFIEFHVGTNPGLLVVPTNFPPQSAQRNYGVQSALDIYVLQSLALIPPHQFPGTLCPCQSNISDEVELKGDHERPNQGEVQGVRTSVSGDQTHTSHQALLCIEART